MQTYLLSFSRIHFSPPTMFFFFGPLCFKFIQLKHFRQFLLKYFEKENLENIFQLLIDFFNF